MVTSKRKMLAYVLAGVLVTTSLPVNVYAQNSTEFEKKIKNMTMDFSQASQDGLPYLNKPWNTYYRTYNQKTLLNINPASKEVLNNSAGLSIDSKVIYKNKSSIKIESNTNKIIEIIKLKDIKLKEGVFNIEMIVKGKDIKKPTAIHVNIHDNDNISRKNGLVTVDEATFDWSKYIYQINNRDCKAKNINALDIDIEFLETGTIWIDSIAIVDVGIFPDDPYIKYNPCHEKY